MAWRVEFLPAADKAFEKLDRQQQRRIQKFIETQTILLVTIGDRKDVYR
jgi:mRNA-degrading endonuclease RelE of RelBE toxin-antitoxin system